MTHAQQDAQPGRPTSVAPLKNVAACLTLCEEIIAARPGLPNIGVFSGFSGYGKTLASQYAMTFHGAIYVDVADYWTAKRFCQALLSEVGEHKPRGTRPEMMDRLIETLGDQRARLIIIDEADKLIDKKLIETVRDLNRFAQVPILLVGEELLPQKLESVERVHNRVRDFVLAQPCDLADARVLAKFLFPQLLIDDELLDLIRQRTGGNARRIVSTLQEAETWARNAGVAALTRENHMGRIFTGHTPRRHEQRKAA